ncbi:OmpA family protein [Vibrio algarum]|uniref:OmpA family protein n=1 Tax=Vibrio algarum TaxID=3020714 RepID=UPI00389A1372
MAFEFNSDKFIETPETTTKLDQLIKLLNQYPYAHAQIVGHTDSIGTKHYNKKLSEKRALSVLEILKKKGVDTNRLSVIAKGESQPIATNMYAPGRAKNRRVELIILSFQYTVDE